jgi:hypothetical protein
VLEGLHPALERELRGRVSGGGGEVLADEAGDRGERDDVTAALLAHTGRTVRVTFSGPKKFVSI